LRVRWGPVGKLIASEVRVVIIGVGWFGCVSTITILPTAAPEGEPVGQPTVPNDGFRRPRTAAFWRGRGRKWLARFVQDLSRLATFTTGNNRE